MIEKRIFGLEFKEAVEIPLKEAPHVRTDAAEEDMDIGIPLEAKIRNYLAEKPFKINHDEATRYQKIKEISRGKLN